jgi:hypothetical protein
MNVVGSAMPSLNAEFALGQPVVLPEDAQVSPVAKLHAMPRQVEQERVQQQA